MQIEDSEIIIIVHCMLKLFHGLQPDFACLDLSKQYYIPLKRHPIVTGVNLPLLFLINAMNLEEKALRRALVQS